MKKSRYKFEKVTDSEEEVARWRLLARHARQHGPREGHACLDKLAQGTLCNILNEQEIKPHKVRYYLERRDPDLYEDAAVKGYFAGA
jgi:hypothetical protein